MVRGRGGGAAVKGSLSCPSPALQKLNFEDHSTHFKLSECERLSIIARIQTFGCMGGGKLSRTV